MKNLIRVWLTSLCCLPLISSAQNQPRDTLATGLVSDCDNIAYRYVNHGSPPINNYTLKNPAPSADLSKYLPFIEDQGYKGSCTAFSVAAALTILENKKINKVYSAINRKDEQYYFSPAFIFNVAKSNYPEPMSSECRLGISYIDAFLVVKNYGTVSWHTYPYSSVDNNQCSSKVPDGIKTSAGLKRILTFQKPKISKEVFKAFLCDQNLEYPINISVHIDNNYWNAGYNLNNHGRGLWEGKSDGKLQRSDQHALCIVGYNDSKHAFKVLDSRGTQWGDSGFIWMDYKLIDDPTVVYDAFVCSFDNKLLLETNNEAQGGSKNSQFSKIDTTFVQTGFFQPLGNYRIACADISVRKKTADILIRDFNGNPLTPITTIGLSKNDDDETVFTVNHDKITIKITNFIKNNILSPSQINFIAKIDIDAVE